MKPSHDQVKAEVERFIVAAGGGRTAGELENLADALESVMRHSQQHDQLQEAAILELRLLVLELRRMEPARDLNP